MTSHQPLSQAISDAMSTTTVATRWSVEDYHRIIETGILADRAVELLNGVVIDMAPEGTPHAAYSHEAGDYLRSVLGNRAKVREGKPITLLPDSEPEPDIAIVYPHPIEVYLQHHPYPEDVFWIIEFSDSSLNKDLNAKNKIYAAAGMKEYWVVNLRELSLTIFRKPGISGYQFEHKLFQGTVSPLAFPEVSISISRLLGRVN